MSQLALLGGSKVREKSFITLPVIGDSEKRRVLNVLDEGVLSGFIADNSDAFLGGCQVRELEASVCQYFNVKHTIAVNSATAGLHAALAALGIGPGDEVIVTPYTMSATATAIVMANGVPVFADIEESGFCLDPNSVESCINERTKAIVVVHLFGGTANMNKLMQIAKQHGLSLVEDCAQAPGARTEGSQVGTMGDVGVFSLNQHKTITCGEGGFAITNNSKLAQRIQLIRNHGEAVVGSMKVEDLTNMIGFNYRMTELEAAVAIEQFRRLDELNSRNIELANYLTSKLSKFEGFILPASSQDRSNVFFVYPIRIMSNVCGITRNEFIKAINAEGIPMAAGYVRPLYLEPMYQKKIASGKSGFPFKNHYQDNNVNYAKGICPTVERMYEEELMLTSVCKHPQTLEDMDDISDAFEKVMAHKSEIQKQPI